MTMVVVVTVAVMKMAAFVESYCVSATVLSIHTHFRQCVPVTPSL